MTLTFVRQNAKYSLAALFFIALFFMAPKTHADPLGGVTSYTIPTSGAGPYAIAEGSDGNLWFTEQTGNKIGQITPSGTITEFALSQSNSYPADIVNGPDGSLWFTASNGSYVGKITTSGSVSQYALPSGAQPLGITDGPDGDLWIAGNGGYNRSNHVYRMNDSGSYTDYTLDRAVTTSFVVSDPVHNEVWFDGRDSNLNGWIFKFSMDGTETDYELPTQATNLYSMTLGPDGNVYFIYGYSTGHDYVGKITNDGTITTADLGAGHGLWYIREGLDGNLWATEYTSGQVDKISTSLAVTPVATGLSSPIGLASGSDGNMWVADYGSGQISKIGEGTITPTDQDGDGLTAAQELQQGTSDLVADTDHDGLSDYTESPWNTQRSAEFCNGSVTLCANPDPLKRDIYVEMDWMVDPSGVSYRPSTSQLDAVQTAFLAYGINFHFDNGNLDGGNQVPYNQTIYWLNNANNIDFLDYKNGGDGIPAEFDSSIRGGIWHYMLFGYHFGEEPSTSGVSSGGGPDTFISYGYIKDHPSGWPNGQYSDFDTAISGTILHELGHTICLTNPLLFTYPGQPQNCQYEGVDSPQQGIPSYPDYKSVMNYLYQLSMVDYSAGTGGANVDHDDWSALTPSDFNRPGGGSHDAPQGQMPMQVKLQQAHAVIGASRTEFNLGR